MLSSVNCTVFSKFPNASLPCQNCDKRTEGHGFVCTCPEAIAQAMIADLGNGDLDDFTEHDLEHCERCSRYFPIAVTEDPKKAVWVALLDYRPKYTPYFRVMIRNTSDDPRIDTDAWSTLDQKGSSIAGVLQGIIEEIAPHGYWKPVTLLRWNDSVTQVLHEILDCPEGPQNPAGIPFTVFHSQVCSNCYSVYEKQEDRCPYCSSDMDLPVPAEALVPVKPDWKTLCGGLFYDGPDKAIKHPVYDEDDDIPF